MNISGELVILPENTEKSVKLHKVKVVTSIKNNIVSVGLLLQDGDEIEAKLGIININHKGTIMKFRSLAKYGLYYFHASQIQHKPGMTETIYKINDDKKLKDMEEKIKKNTKEENNPSFIVKSVPVMNRKEKDENGDINTKITSTK